MPLVLPKIPKRSDKRKHMQQADAYRQVLRKHAQLGGQLFGPVPEGRRREFFCLDDRTWVWHEEWQDELGKHHSMTTRYDIRPDGVLKSQGAHSYQRVQGEELQNLYRAAMLYRDQVHQGKNMLEQQVAAQQR